MSAWKRLAKAYRIDLLKLRKYNAGLAEEAFKARLALEYLESRVSDYPILEILLKEARK